MEISSLHAIGVPIITHAARLCAMSEGKQIGERVRRLRESLGWNQAELAYHAGVDPSYIWKLEAGQVPRPGGLTLAKVARGLRVPLRQLVEEAETQTSMRRPTEELLAELRASLPIRVPVVRQPASAGPGNVIEYEYLPPDPGWSERREDFLGVPVSGNCMAPRIEDGDIVIIDQKAEPKIGDTVVALHDGEAIIKKLAREHGHLRLVAAQGRPPIDVVEDTRIIGVVIRIVKKP